jgi:cytochrome c
MRFFSRIALPTAVTALPFVCFGALAADDGATLYKIKACHACHGDDGKTTVLPTYPKLAGQSAPYLLEQMKAIRDGQRTNGFAAAMRPLMASVSDEEFTAIANWLSTLP